MQLWNDSTISLFAEDEVHIQQRTTVMRMWWPRGSQPQIPSAPTRKHMGYWGAVNLHSGHLCTQRHPGKFNWITFQDFLENFLRTHYRRQHPIAMLFDNASYHKKQDLAPFFKSNKHRLCPVWLPPYSPNLNPIERVWRLTRRQVTHNRYFESLNELVDSLDCFFNFLKRPNVILRALCAIT